MSRVLDYRAFFNLDDDSSIKDAIENIGKLKKVYASLANSIEKNNKKISEGMDSIKTESEKLSKSLDGVNVSYEENRKHISDVAKSSAELSKKNKELEASYKLNQKALKQTASEIDRLNSAQDKYAKSQAKSSKNNEAAAGSINDLKKQLKSATDAYNALGREASDAVKADALENIRKLSTELNENRKQLNEVRKSTKVLAGSYNELSLFVREGRKELKAMAGGLDGNSDEFKKLQKEVSEANKKLKEWDKSIGDNFRSVGDYEIALQGLGGQFSQIGTVITNPAQALSGFASSIPIPQVAAFAGAIVGVTEGMGALFAIADEVRGQLKEVADITGLADDALESLTAGIIATSETFGQDFNDVLQATNVLIEEFDISGEEALEKINNGFITGANASGELLDSIKEYSVQLADGAASAEDLIGIISVSADEGIFSDKLIDSVKEAQISLREYTKSTQDAIEPLGKLRVEQIETAVAAGNYFEATQLVAKGLSEVNLSASQTGTIIADVFRGAGEDAGIDILKTLANIGDETQNATKELNKYQKTVLANLEAQQDLADAQVELSESLSGSGSSFKLLGTNIQTFAIKLFLRFVEVLRPLGNALSELFDAFKSIASQFVSFGKEGEKTVDIFDVLTYSTRAIAAVLSVVVTVIANVVQGISDLISNVPFLDKIFSSLGKTFGFFIEVINEAPAFIIAFLDSSVTAFIEFKKLIGNVFLDIGEIIKAALDPRKSVSEVLNDSVDRFSDFGNKVGKAFSDRLAEERAKTAENNIEIAQKEAESELKIKEKQAAAVTNAEKKENEKRLKLASSQADKLAKMEQKALEARLKLLILEQQKIEDTNNKIAENELMTLEQRLQAASNASQARLNIIDLEKEKALSKIGLQNDEILLIEAQFAQARVAQEQALQDKLREISLEESEEQLESDELNTENEKLKKLAELNEKFRNGELKNAEEFEKQKEKIEKESEISLLNNQLDFLERKFEILKKAGFDTTQVEQQILKTRNQIAQIGNDELIQKEKDLQDALKELKDVAIESAFKVIENLNEKEDEKRELELEKLDEQEEKELELAGDNEEKKLEIKEAFAAKRKVIEREQAEADRKRAIFEKSVAALEIGVNTAKAISKAVSLSPATGGLPFSAIVAAIGAAQLAAVLSQPIPQFEKGTQFAPEGLAMVNEAGPEIIQFAGRERIINSDGPTLTYLQRGSKVFDAEKTAEILQNRASISGGLGSSAAEIESKNNVTIVDSNSREIVNAIVNMESSIMSKKQAVINLNKRELEFLTTDGQRFMKYMNKKYGK